jgi:hypothetical protein
LLASLWPTHGFLVDAGDFRGQEPETWDEIFSLGTLRETTPFPKKTARQKSTGCSRNLAVEIKEW